MINKMESSCCHGDLKHSGQAQACAENGLIGKDTDDWGLDHKGPAVSGLIRSGFWHGGSRDSEEPAAPFWGCRARRSRTRRGRDVSSDGESRGCRALINST